MKLLILLFSLNAFANPEVQICMPLSHLIPDGEYVYRAEFHKRNNAWFRYNASLVPKQKEPIDYDKIEKYTNRYLMFLPQVK